MLGLCGWMSLGRDSATPDGTPSQTPRSPSAAALASVPAPAPPQSPPALDPTVAGTYETLAFQELFVSPVGPRGLEYTAKSQRLAGQKVKMTGHMVRHYHDDPRVFLFTATPNTHDQREYMLADSLPVSLVHVFLEARPGQAPDWRPRSITVYGTLEAGPQQEVDGRVSHVRLHAEHVTEGATTNLLELRRPIVLQRNRMKAGQTAATTNPGGRQPHLRPRTDTPFPQSKPTQTPSSSS
jgi:hypothetical protein